MRQVRTTMTELDRGLALHARRGGFTIESLCEIFHRDRETLRRLFKKHRVMQPREDQCSDRS